MKLQTWKDGTFDQQYTLPTSGQKFGTNQRFCDATHYCAVVVADANPEQARVPRRHRIAVHRSEADRRHADDGQAADHDEDADDHDEQEADDDHAAHDRSTAGDVGSDAAADRRTDDDDDRADALADRGGGGTAGGGGAQGGGSASVTVTPSTPATLPSRLCRAAPTANPVPPQVGDAAITQACAQLAQVVQQGGGDASALDDRVLDAWSTAAAVRSSSAPAVAEPRLLRVVVG